MVGKMGLVDKFGRVHKYLRISLIDRCNLACNYCMPPSAPQPSSSISMTAAEIERLAGIFVNRCGITKIRLTGGEPTLRSDFGEICDRLGSLGAEQLAITTNGVLLHRYEDVLLKNKMKHWNVSLDTLERDKFPLISNKPESFFDKTWANVRRAVELVGEGRLSGVKINTVAMRHVNDDEFVALVELTRAWPIQLRFIELMPFSGNNYSSKLFLPKSEILSGIRSVFPLEPVGTTESNASVGREVWRVPSFRGEVAVISSMTDAFCGACDRLRVTADGSLRSCLFSRDADETSLLSIMRSGGSDDQIEGLIRENVDKKFYAHGGQASVADLARSVNTNRPMVAIGG